MKLRCDDCGHTISYELVDWCERCGGPMNIVRGIWMDETPEAWDVYWAFRCAFAGHPEVRIAIRDPRPQSGRFVQDAGLRVYLWSEDPKRGAHFTHVDAPIEAPRAATIHGDAYDDVEHWAAMTAAWWEGRPVGVVAGKARKLESNADIALAWGEQLRRAPR